MLKTPGILFLCVHNAGRSQMAAGFAKHLGGEGVRVFSGGSEPANQVNSAAVEAMSEMGIDISSMVPQAWTMEQIEAVDVVVTMGCGDTCPYIPGKRYLEWTLDDPAGESVQGIRPIRDEIERLVRDLLIDLGVNLNQ